MRVLSGGKTCQCQTKSRRTGQTYSITSVRCGSGRVSRVLQTDQRTLGPLVGAPLVSCRDRDAVRVDLGVDEADEGEYDGEGGLVLHVDDYRDTGKSMLLQSMGLRQKTIAQYQARAGVQQIIGEWSRTYRRGSWRNLRRFCSNE